MTNNNNTASASVAGFPIFGAAFAVLLVLKVAGMAGASWGLANLSWFWVFSPLIFGIAFALVFLVIFLLVAVFFASR